MAKPFIPSSPPRSSAAPKKPAAPPKSDREKARDAIVKKASKRFHEAERRGQGYGR